MDGRGRAKQDARAGHRQTRKSAARMFHYLRRGALVSPACNHLRLRALWFCERRCGIVFPADCEAVAVAHIDVLDVGLAARDDVCDHIEEKNGTRRYFAVPAPQLAVDTLGHTP